MIKNGNRIKVLFLVVSLFSLFSLVSVSKTYANAIECNTTAPQCVDYGGEGIMCGSDTSLCDCGSQTASCTDIPSQCGTAGWIPNGPNWGQCAQSCSCSKPPVEINIPGCTDPTASNYDPEATYDDGSCDYGPSCGTKGGNTCNASCPGGWTSTNKGPSYDCQASCLYCAPPPGGGGAVCGNGVLESGEQCDSANLNGQSCTTLGHDGGALSCTSSCTFNEASCTDTGDHGGGVSGPCDVTYANNRFHVCFYPGFIPLGTGDTLSQYDESSIPSPVGAYSAFSYNWGDGEIDGTGAFNSVSASWRGRINFQAGTYVFHTMSSDGAAVTVEGFGTIPFNGVNYVIFNPISHTNVQDNSAPVVLPAGYRNVKVDWYEDSGSARMAFWWDFTPPAGPDLTASGVTPVVASVGAPVSFTGTISNTGTVTTGSGFNNFFQSSLSANGGGPIYPASVNPTSAIGPGGSVNVSSTAFTPVTPGIYSVRVCADNNASMVGTITESNESNNCGPWTNVSVGPALNYTLSNSGNSSVTKSSGNVFTQNTIIKNLVSGGTQPVTLTLSGVPSGTSYSISNGTCSPTCMSVITFTVSPSTQIGTYPITVVGSPLSKQTTFNLVVSGNPVTVSCSANPLSALINQTVTWTANVTGGTPPFTYTWSGTGIPTNPAPHNNPLSISYTTIGQKSATVTVTDTNSVSATCPTSIVQINFSPIFEEF